MRAKVSMLHLAVASQRFTNSAGEFAENLVHLCDKVHPTAALLSEVTHRDKEWTRRFVADLGYRFIDPHPASDVAFLLRDGHRFHGAETVRVQPAQPGLARNGGHSARSIETMRFEHNGNAIAFHGAHWSTGYARNKQRRREAIEMWVKMAKQAERGQLDFWGGDVNWDEDDAGDNRPKEIMGRAWMRTVFDDLGKNTPTHGRRQIDLIGTWNRQRRVTATSARVRRSPNSDHRVVSAFYAIGPKS